jgi:hypothetical protein
VSSIQNWVLERQRQAELGKTPIAWSQIAGVHARLTEVIVDGGYQSMLKRMLKRL